MTKGASGGKRKGPEPRKGPARKSSPRKKPSERKGSSRAADEVSAAREEPGFEESELDRPLTPEEKEELEITRPQRPAHRSSDEPLPTDAAPADAAVSLGTVGEPMPHHDFGFRPTVTGWAVRGVALAAVAALLIGFPLTRSGPEAGLFTKAVVYAIIGLSLNVLIGYTGQISLGHQAFVGIGAFTSAYVVSQSGQSFAVAVIVAMLVGGAQALMLGLVSLRIRGLYFALVTLSYGLFAEKTLFKIDSLTGGAAGQNAPRPAMFETEHAYYFLCLVFLGAVLWVDYRLTQTKGGRALLALRENPRVAATFGVNVTLYTLFAFIVSGVFAGLGGALLAHNDTQVSAVSFNFQLALIFVIMTVVGGLKSRPGIVIGSALFALTGYLIEHVPGLQTGLNALPGPDLSAGAAALVLGPLLLLLTLTVFPGGIGQQIRPVTQWLLGHRFDPHDRGLAEVQVTDVRA